MVDQQASEEYILKNASDSEFEFRKVLKSDFEIGFPDVLKGLTEVGNVSRELFEARFDALFNSRSDIYKVIVVIDLAANRVIGSGTLMLE